MISDKLMDSSLLFDNYKGGMFEYVLFLNCALVDKGDYRLNCVLLKIHVKAVTSNVPAVRNNAIQEIIKVE